MENYNNLPFHQMPISSRLTDEQLSEAMRNNKSGIHFNISALIEADRRKNERIKELEKENEDMKNEIREIKKDFERRLSRLEKKALQKPGRKKQSFSAPAFGFDHELTDADLCRLIDEGYYDSIGKMERELGASKNQLRNRINKERERKRLEWEVEEYGNR